MTKCAAFCCGVFLAVPAASAAEAALPERMGVLLGRLHQAVAHFPVALLLVAGALELLGAVFASERVRAAARVCLAFGAAAAVDPPHPPRHQRPEHGVDDPGRQTRAMDFNH